MSHAAAPAVELSRPDSTTVAVHGALTFDTAQRALEALRQELGERPATVLDLAAVSRSDSAGLACTLAVLAHCRRQNQPLALRNVPDAMRALATVCAADTLLV